MRKLLTAATVGIFLALGVGTNQAQAGFRGLEFYPKVEHFNYKEYENGKVVDKEDGNLKGFGIKTEGLDHILIPIYSEFRIEFMTGDTDYDGAVIDLQTGKVTPYSSTTHNKIIYGELFFGPQFQFGKEWKVTVTPGFDLAVRRWDRELDTYTEHYYWFAYGGGIKADVQKGKFHAGLKAYYQKAKNPKLDADFGDNGDETFDLGSTHTWGIQLRTGYDLSKRWTVFAEYEYRYTHIDSGPYEDLGGVPFHEPESKTRENMFSVGVALRF